MSTRRFAFIIDSRDFSTATEKAVQGSSTRTTDHALEHLIEIANRSPEICIVLDGLGHMSVWGIENAGYKNRIPPTVFHISHVDGMDIHVPQLSDPLEDYIQFCIFAGGATRSSLSILLHSFAGDIDWYDTQITHLFDTAIRRDRTHLISSLAGHGAPIQHLVRNVIGTIILSTTDEGQASIWQHGGKLSTAPLLRRNSFTVGADIKDAVVLSRGRYAAILSSLGLELWDIREAKAKRLDVTEFERNHIPERITQSRIASERALTSRVIVGYYADHSVEAWELLLPATENGYPSKSNGYRELIRSLGHVRLHVQNRFSSLLAICDNMSTNERPADPREINALSFTAALAKDGVLEMVKAMEEPDSTKPHLASGAVIETNIQRPKMISASGYGKVVVINEDSNSLSIWDAKTGAWEYEHDLDGTDTIKTFAWAVSPQGSALVAVCFDYHIVVLGQVRYSYPDLGQAWVDLRHIRIRDFTTHSAGDLCWLRNGDFVVGTGIQFFVFKGYASTHHNEEAKPIRDIQAKLQSDATFAVMSMLNSLLPIFHPTFLSLLTCSVGVSATKDVIRQLYRQLKFFSEGDELPSFLDMPVGEITASMRLKTPHVHSYYGTNGDVNGGVEPEAISDISQSLADNLQKYQFWQITPAEQTLLSKQTEMISELEKQEQSVDVNAQRYLQALYMSGEEEVPWSAIAFASMSTSQEILVDLVTRFFGGKLTWEAARKSGLFCWLSDGESLRLQMENVGRAEFTKGEDRNPVDCSLYYLALKKKPVLQGLWRMTTGIREKENTMKLLANNFNEPRWKSTALKNAYALLSKRRFQYAAAFFLLGGSLWDAVNVCVHQLKDLQLAIAIARVYENEAESLTWSRLIDQTILPLAVESEQGRWMASWAYSALGRTDTAIQVLVQPVHAVVGRSLSEIDGMVGSLSYAANDPLLTVLYLQLRAQLVKQNKWRNVISSKDEWAFVMRCVRQYLRMGCDVLALSLVRDWEFVLESPDPTTTTQATNNKETEGSVGSPPPAMLQRRKTFFDLEKEEDEEALSRSTTKLDRASSEMERKKKMEKPKPPPTQFEEPSGDSLLDSFGF